MAMSGGYWDYIQFRIDGIALDLELKLETESWSDDTVAHFKDAMDAVRIASIYVHEIDWLLSGDTGEEALSRRLSERLSKYKKE